MIDNLRQICIWLVLLAVTLSACTTGGNKEDTSKFQHYYVKGEALYVKHCSNCHQKDGSGLGLLYPPLNPSDYLTNNFEAVVCLQRQGISGELIVNGKSFNKEMPAPLLTDLDIAMITTYLYNSWGNKKGLIDVTQTSQILRDCPQR